MTEKIKHILKNGQDVFYSLKGKIISVGLVHELKIVLFPVKKKKKQDKVTEGFQMTTQIGAETYMWVNGKRNH